MDNRVLIVAAVLITTVMADHEIVDYGSNYLGHDRHHGIYYGGNSQGSYGQESHESYHGSSSYGNYGQGNQGIYHGGSQGNLGQGGHGIYHGGNGESSYGVNYGGGYGSQGNYGGNNHGIYHGSHSNFGQGSQSGFGGHYGQVGFNVGYSQGGYVHALPLEY